MFGALGKHVSFPYQKISVSVIFAGSQSGGRFDESYNAHVAIFEFLTTVSLKNQFRCDVIPSRMADSYRSFEEPCCFQHASNYLLFDMQVHPRGLVSPKRI
jgi:hypothetical protein